MNIVTRINLRQFSQSFLRKSDFSHVVIGGGVVGTAIASELSRQNSNVLLVEKHEKLGMETTSRNSEVIHAGLYYQQGSLKEKLCIAGKNKIYDAYNKGVFDSIQVPLKKCGKWVVAQDEIEMEYLEKLYKHSQTIGVPSNMISAQMVAKQNPRIKAIAGALESPTTGIISVHDLVLFYESQLANQGGVISLNTLVRNIQYNKNTPNYIIEMESLTDGQLFEVTTDNVINSAGLYAVDIANMLLGDKYKAFFAKGSYFSYQPPTPGRGKISDKLIYPCPNANASSLGIHLTFDLGGQIRFGPDLEWLEEINNANDINYDVSINNLELAYKSIKRYFPEITLESLQPSYSGVRPKILSRKENQKQFADFFIHEEEDYPGFVNLLGIESPGVTASWAIADYVKEIYYK